MLSVLDYTVFFFYLITLLGLYIYRRKTASLFFNPKDKSTVLGLGFSIYATIVSSIAFIGVPGKSFTGNWAFTGYYCSIPIIIVIGYFIIIPYQFKKGLWLSFDHLKETYGEWASGFSSILFVMMNIGRIAVILHLLNSFSSILNSSYSDVIVFSIFLIIVIQCSFGGFNLVVKTDIFQALLMATLSMLSLFLILSITDRGPFDLVNQLQSTKKINFDWSFTEFDNSNFIVFFIFGIFDQIRLMTTDQAVIQRIMASKGLAEARKSFLLGFFLMTLTLLVSVLIGGSLLLFYEKIPLDFKSDQAFPLFVLSYFPPVLKGLAVIGIISAVMSSIDSSLESCTNIIARKFIIFPNKVFERLHEKHRYIFSCLFVAILSFSFYLLIKKTLWL